MRYGPKDFGYTFVKQSDEENEPRVGGGNKEADGDEEQGVEAQAATAETSSAVGDKDTKDVSVNDDDPLRRSSRAGDTSRRPYVYTPPKRSGGGKEIDNEDGSGSSSSSGGGQGALTALIGGCGACCCCLSAALIVAGGTMLAYEKYDLSGKPDPDDVNNDHLEFAGVVALIVAAAFFLLGCCSCCFGCLSACGGEVGGSVSGLGFGDDEGDNDKSHDIRVKFRRLNDRYETAEDSLNRIHLNVIGGMKDIKEAQKKEEKKKKDEEKTKKEQLEARVKKDLEAGLTVNNIRRNYRPIAFLVRFEGDMMVSSLELFRKQVSIVVNCGRAGVDRAVIVVTSPGGAVSNYGLAASQLARIRKAGIELIICVDTVAASGGFMMASMGDKICAAPFAVIGSIGVVTQVPNFQRFLNRHDVDAFLFTAGKHKRTVDVIGDVTEEGKQKLQSELDDIHRAFKDHIALARPRLRNNIEDVATGEWWLSVQAKELGLVDTIMTSDEYLESICAENEIIEIVEKKKKKKWHDGLLASVMKGFADHVSAQQYRTPPPMAMA